MQLINTTDFPDYFLRRMVSWCCGQVGYSTHKIGEAKFRNRGDGRYSGRAYGSRRFVVSVGAYKWVNDGTGDGSCTVKTKLTQEERMGALIRVTAHEIFHLKANREGINSRRYGQSRGSSEEQTKWHEHRALEVFEQDREPLIAQWSKPPVERLKTPNPTLQENRAAVAQANLDNWLRKLKLAQTKVKKYRTKMRYYDKALAAKRSK